jgi:hypothetical protein
MKKILLWGLSLLIGNVCYAEDITISYNGSKAKVTQTAKDSVKVTVDGARVNIESLYKDHKLTLLLKGKSDDGQLTLKTAGKAKIKLSGLELTSQEGAPIDLKNKKKVEIVATKGSENTLTITACNDTANHKAAVIWAKDKLLLSGKGTLNIIATGDGCRGIKTKKDITIEELTLNVTTSGDNLGEKPFGFGGGFPGMPEGGFPFGNDSTMQGGFPNFGGGFPNFGGGFPNFGGFPMPNDSTMRGNFPNFGGFPGGFPMPNDSTMQGGFPNFGGGFPNFGGFPMGGFPDFGNRDENDSIQGGFGGFGGKHKYVASTKGIASKGKITINSGNVTVRTTTAGAEGIEGKEGIVFNGGNVDVLSPDDAINANATIEFNGAHVIARSTGNDAIDSNPKGGFFMPFGGNNNDQDTDPAIVIQGGTVYAWSQVGSPEEGLDCDFAPLVIEGGTIFTVGGGMGEMPSVPTNDTAKQPTVLLIGLNVVKDEPITVSDADGKLIDTVTVPFSMRRSASLVGSPAFKLGNTYTIKTKGYEKTFTLNENFTTVR